MMTDAEAIARMERMRHGLIGAVGELRKDLRALERVLALAKKSAGSS